VPTQTLLNTQGAPKMGKLVATKESFLNDMPFAITLAATTALPLGLLFAELGPDSVAAGPLILAPQMLIMGCARSFFAVSQIFISGLYGALNADTPADEANTIFHQIGGVIQVGWLCAALVSVISIALLASTPALYQAMGISNELTAQVSDYFAGYNWGIPFILHSYADLQLATSLKNSWFPIARGVAYTGLSYSLAKAASQYGMPGMPKGIAGVGAGASLAAVIIAALTKLVFYCNEKIRRCALYQCTVENRGAGTFTQRLKNFTNLGGKLSSLVLVEWINVVITTQVLSRTQLKEFGKDGNTAALRASQPGLQLAAALILWSFGHTAALGGACAGKVGALRTVLTTTDNQQMVNYNGEQNQANTTEIAKANFNQRGNIGMAVSMLLPTVVAAASVIAPQLFTALLLHSGANDMEQNLANGVVRALGAGIFFDGLRVSTSGPLRGVKDIPAAGLMGFITMTLINLSITAPLLLMGEISLPLFFWARTISTIPATAFNVYRWYHYQRATPEALTQLQDQHAQNGWSCSMMWRPFSAATATHQPVATVDNSV
jgi:hypothetical protein